MPKLADLAEQVVFAPTRVGCWLDPFWKLDVRWNDP